MTNYYIKKNLTQLKVTFMIADTKIMQKFHESGNVLSLGIGP